MKKNCFSTQSGPPGAGGCRPPVIVDQPESQQASTGVSINLSVTVSGTSPFQYQWYHNGAVISGATASTYTKSNIQYSDAGLYRVKATNRCGSKFSENALVVVTSASGGKKTIFVTGDDFEAGTNIYHNADIAGKTEVQILMIGAGFLKYNYADPNDPINEYTVAPNGDIEIIIPGFDVHDGNNYFNITY